MTDPWGWIGIGIATAQPGYFLSTRYLLLSDCVACVLNSLGDPISPASGNVSHHDTDIPAQGTSPQSVFQRFYNSSDPGSSVLGVGWRHSFSRSVVGIVSGTPYMAYPNSDPLVSSRANTPADACNYLWPQIRSTVPQWASATASYTPGTLTGGTCSLSSNGTVITSLPVFNSVAAGGVFEDQPPISGFNVIRDDGQQIAFTLNGSALVPPAGITWRLTQTSSGFQLIDNDDNVEVYNSSGQLLSVTSRTGIAETLAYDASNRLSTVTDSFGHQLTLGYNAQNQLATVTDPSSATVQYGYDSQGRLSTVTNLDGTTRTYVYENTNLARLLTGVIDESGVRYSTWGYDTQGRGTSSQEAGGADAVGFTYNGNGSVTTTDALGAVRTFSFNIIGQQNRVTAITGSQCPTCQEAAATTYDAAGFVSSRTDYDGNVTCYANDPVRGLELVRVEGFASGSTCPSNLAAYTPASGTTQRKIATTWSSSYRLPTQIVEATRTTSFGYDSSGNLLTRTVTDTTVTPNVSRTWIYTYNNYGQVLTVDGPRSDVADVTTYTYYSCTTGSQCGQIQTVTDAAGHLWTYNAYDVYGRPLRITDPNGIVTTLAYDSRGRLTSRNTAGETTGFAYYPTGLLKTVTLPDNSALTYTYDGAHRLTQISDTLGNKLVYTLDALGNRTAEKTYDPSGTLHRTHTRVFNTLSELSQDINAANTAAVTTTYGYDSNGNQTSAAAPLSRNTGEAFDALNRLKQITDPASGVTQLGYDANDNLVSVTDPRTLVTAYAYDGFGDLLTQRSPDTGNTTNTYDSAGNLATSTDARGAVSTYTYDAVNRVNSVAYSLGGVTDQTVSFTYDSGTNGSGHLTGASDTNHTMSWGYDALGRVITKIQNVNGVTKSVGYAYTSGDLTTLTTPSGQTVTYGYNGNHQITSVSVNGTSVLNSVTYEPFGPVSGWMWGNGTATTRTYTGDGTVSQIASNGVKTYSYDNALRITGITDTSPGSSNWTYGYDSLDRISSGTNGTVTRGWTYDSNGNRLTETGSSPSTYSVAATSNQITGITGALAHTYAYDAAGHTTGYSSMTATYNDAGRLKTVSSGAVTETLIYNALGQRIETSGSAAGAILYWYDEQGHLLGEYNGAGNLIEETVWLGDIPVAVLQPGSSGVTLYCVHTDQLSTPRQVTRPADNAQMWTWFSDPFGSDAANSNPSGAGAFAYNLRFPGQVFDGQVGLHSNYFRDYDPATGRYIEGDPTGIVASFNDPALQVGVGMLDGFDDGAVGALNEIYAYADGNPLGIFDPTGLAGKSGRGISGGSSGKGTNNPYKHCVEDPTDPNFIICKDKTTGKKVRKPKPADWPKTKMEACDTCQKAADVVVVGGVGYIVYRCVRMIPSLAPPLWWTIPENALIP